MLWLLRRSSNQNGGVLDDSIVAFAVVSFCAGVGAGSFFLRLKYRAESAAQATAASLQQERCAVLEEQLTAAQERFTATREELSRATEALSQKEAHFAEQVRLISETKQGMTEQFRAISYQALEKSTQDLLTRFQESTSAFLSHAQLESKQQTVAGQKALEQIGGAITKQLGDFDRCVQEMQRSRAAADADIKGQLMGLAKVSQDVGSEANRLRSVLTNSRVRGEWGQLQLQRIVESAGMTEHVDFFLEESSSVDGKQQRPDMRVQLPNGLSVMIDVKAPGASYGKAIEATDPQVRQEWMRQHVSALRAHIREMGRRDYPSIKERGEVFSHTIVFLPNESLFYAALENDNELLNFAEQNRVLVATPLSLLAFLRAVAAGWTHVTATENAQKIQQTARTLHERLMGFLEGVGEVGKRLEGTVKAFNGVAARQQNIRASFRHLAELGVGEKDECTEIAQLETELRQVSPLDSRLRESVALAEVDTTEALPPESYRNLASQK